MKIDKIVKYLNSDTIMEKINLCDGVADIISLILWILLMILLVTIFSGNKFMHHFTYWICRKQRKYSLYLLWILLSRSNAVLVMLLHFPLVYMPESCSIPSQ